MQIINEIDFEFINACSGIVPDIEVDTNILRYFTKEKIYSIHAKFFKIASKKYIKVY